jgi:type II secretion system protein G
MEVTAGIALRRFCLFGSRRSLAVNGTRGRGILNARQTVRDRCHEVKQFVGVRRDCNGYPDEGCGLNALITNDGAVCWKGPYMQAIPFDPWGRPYRYLVRPDSIEPEIISYGADGREGGESDKLLASLRSWEQEASRRKTEGRCG